MTRNQSLFASFRRLAVASLACGLIHAVSAGVVINEFMAENDGFLHDQDGDTPDWIEVFNDSTNGVNLAGWHLTDSPTNLAKWTFPATNLPAQGYLVVFASGKDRTNGVELHTNFQLDSAGEYLALVQPDGATIATIWTPVYPPQRANVSFSTGRLVQSNRWITAGTSARFFVPTNDMGLAWAQGDFNDANWAVGAVALGYDANNTNPAGTVVLALDFDERNVAPTSHPGFSSFVIASNTSATAIQTNPTTRTFGAISVTLSNTAPEGYDDRIRGTPTNSGAFTESALLRDFVFSRSQNNNGGLDIAISGLAANQVFEATLWSFDTSSAGQRAADWYANGLLVRSNYVFNGAVLPAANDTYRMTFLTQSSPAGQMLLQGRRNSGSIDTAGAANFGVFINALQLSQQGFRGLITTDVEASLRGKNSSIYLRIPFTVTDSSVIQRLKLRMRYADGYVAYLNGQPIASRNAPDLPIWNSTALTNRTYYQAVSAEEIMVVNAPGLLVPGTNILAIHGLNFSVSDDSFLLWPELEGLQVTLSADRYLTPPTPGAENGLGYLGFVEDTKFSVNRGFYDTPFTVAITTATTTATIYYTTNGSRPSPTNGFRYATPLLITNTTLLRAAAFQEGLIPTDVDTHTYLFLDDVLRQPAAPLGYPTNWQANYPADYEMDPAIVNHTNYGATIRNDLRAIPSLSIVTDHNSLWHTATGIYVNSVNAGEAWERAASVELINPDNTTAFHINCGLRMQGNASRDNVRLAKHSFRLLFKSDYGPAKLHYDWFPGSPVNDFDNIILRASFTDSWATRYSDQTAIPGGKGTRYRPEDSLYLRDAWIKDSQAAMGHLAARGDFVHLYVNGFYWGVYNPSERIDSSYCAEYMGGRQADWDVLSGDVTYDFAEVKDGNKDDWNAMLAVVNAGITNETTYQAVAGLVDIENLIDFMLLHIFAEAEDWPHHNWYVVHRHANLTNGLPATRWKFLPWDQEIVLDQLVRRNKVDVNNNDTPARIYGQLRAWPEFRRLFGDRIQKHLFNNGALIPTNNIARLMTRAARIDRAIVGESARWGDAREFTIGANPGHGQTFTRDEWWAPELQKLCTNFCLTLNETNIARFRAAGLYPNLGTPTFNQFGGAVAAGFILTMTHTNTAGTIFFTLDGSDPRVYGTGEVAPSAQVYSDPVILNSPTQARARVQSGAEWSALVEAMFYPPQDLSKLALTELMYNPPAMGTNESSDFEFLELKNTGTNTLNLSGLLFSRGISYTFTNGTMLAPDQFFVLARNLPAFAAKYPGVPVQGLYTGRLDNAGETIMLAHPLGENIFSLSYDNTAPWPAAANNWGFSIVQKFPSAYQAPDDGAKWRASSVIGGSPGADDPVPAIPRIVINEVLTASELPQVDAIELRNLENTNAPISGWFLTDDARIPMKFRIPDGVTIPANGYWLFDERDFNPTPGTNNSFSLSAYGEQVYVFSADGQTNLTGYSHGFHFAAAEHGVSFGRYVNSVGEEQWPAQLFLTLSNENSGPRTGPVVINEIMYHPPPGGDEFVELKNLAAQPVALFDRAQPTNQWRLNGLDYDFPTNIIMEPEAYLLLVATNVAEFRAKYSVPTNVTILGPYAGVLQDSGERLILQRPAEPDTHASGFITLDEVRYNDKAPWPAAADGSGASLQRKNSAAYGNDPINWFASAPTPGRPNAAADADGDGLPDEWEISHGLSVTNSADANLDSDGDGLSNMQEFLIGTDPFNDQSVLKMELIPGAANTWAVSFQAPANVPFVIQSATNLPALYWQAVAEIPAAPTNRTVSFSLISPAANNLYLRVQALLVR